MTLEERIEKAREALMDAGFESFTVDTAIRAAFPELFASPPTHKIVPVVETPTGTKDDRSPAETRWPWRPGTD